jgi:hypothetical protein
VEEMRKLARRYSRMSCSSKESWLRMYLLLRLRSRTDLLPHL